MGVLNKLFLVDVYHIVLKHVIEKRIKFDKSIDDKKNFEQLSCVNGKSYDIIYDKLLLNNNNNNSDSMDLLIQSEDYEDDSKEECIEDLTLYEMVDKLVPMEDIFLKSMYENEIRKPKDILE